VLKKVLGSKSEEIRWELTELRNEELHILIVAPCISSSYLISIPTDAHI